MNTTDLIRDLKQTLVADPTRIILKLFIPGEDEVVARTRTAAVIDRIAHLDGEHVSRLLDQTLRRFGGRHHDLEQTFSRHYELVRHTVAHSADLSPTARLLVGAYFSHEYSVEAAALCNPSMVAHPDQSGVPQGQLRVAISLRQIGEGHVSSIGFTSALLGPGAQIAVAERSGPLRTGRRDEAHQRRDLLTAGLTEEGWYNEVSAVVLGLLPESFDQAQLEHALRQVPIELLIHHATRGTIEQLRRIAAASYSVTFALDLPLHQRVLWPTTPSESNGMEDARFVRHVDADGEQRYLATYTAFDGQEGGARLLSTADFLRFDVTPIRGPAARYKGMALFPRLVDGRHLALCRCAGEAIGLAVLDGENLWQNLARLHGPDRSWEIIQVGNCGPPIETDEGWLVLTHGVGAMRQYAIGALLLDLHDPQRVIAHLPRVLLSPDDDERDGYVPNVVYSCGALLHAGTLWLPYGSSDDRVDFAAVDLAVLLGAMQRCPACR
jgi:predicted GH43/DUF377 family glycosyl hydrolase